MISMKIEYQNDLLIVYLYKYIFSFNHKEELYKEIKNLFINLIKNYHLDLNGYFKVDIYENLKYGVVLEINKIYGNSNDFIDLKIILHHNTKFYLVMDDYHFFNNHDVIIKDNKYYIDIEKIDNILKYVEFGIIKYDK